MDMDEETEDEGIHNTILDVLSVLLVHGYDQVNIGGLMRILGVEPEIAEPYDSVDVPILDGLENTEQLIMTAVSQDTGNTTIH